MTEKNVEQKYSLKIPIDGELSLLLTRKEMIELHEQLTNILDNAFRGSKRTTDNQSEE